MSKEQTNEIGTILFGALTSAGVGSFIFEALGALILGILGAAGAYIFTHVLVPKTKQLIAKLKENRRKIT